MLGKTVINERNVFIRLFAFNKNRKQMSDYND